MKYNYVITGNEMYSPPMFMEIAHLDNVRLYTNIGEDFTSPLGHILFRLHFSKKINRIIPKPFSRYIYKRLYQPDFHNNNNLCIIFMCDKPEIYNNRKYVETIRRQNPNAQLVLYIVDIVGMNDKLDIEYAKNTFDLVVSYDHNDAQQYGLKYYPTPHSKIIPDTSGAMTQSDVYFCGKAKSRERFAKIIRIFELCRAQGLKCDFIITEVPENEKIYADEITYNTEITYLENCQHIINTKAIVEILQNDASGFTPRLWDSIIHEKYLITDNMSIAESKFYDSDGMFILNPQNMSDWDITSFLHSIRHQLKYTDDFKNQLSPVNFLQFIEQNLTHHDSH